MRRQITLVLAVSGCLIAAAGQAHAQDTTARPTGLPKKWNVTFNLDAGFGAFGFNHSLYTDVRPDPSGNLSDNWLESFVKPAISLSIPSGKSEFYGKLSAAGERTFAAPPSIVGTEASSYQIEDAFVGWRSGTSVGKSENLLDFTVGRSPFTLGHGMILWDGGGEGSSRGGFWSNARKAWEFAAIGRIKSKHHNLQAFYLDRDEVPESDTQTRLWGANYELSLGEASTFGASYLHFMANPASLPARDGLNVYNLRAFTAPLKKVPGLAFELEYVKEDNGDLRSSYAWNAKGGYTFGKMGWKPTLSYRYAYFQGDDPNTTKDESFDSLIPGFSDWGSWWQGEIGGEYFLANSNLISHQVRLHLAPSDRVGTGLIGYVFQLDQPSALGAGVTSKDVATELDWYMDWKANSNFTISFVAAFANPQEAVHQAYDRTQKFTYGMIYVAYAY